MLEYTMLTIAILLGYGGQILLVYTQKLIWTIPIMAALTIGIFGVNGAYKVSNNYTKSTDYQIICNNDTLTLLDSDIIVKKIPYSDSSDIWKIIVDDNR